MKKSISLSLLASVMIMAACSSEEYLVAPERQNWTFEIDMSGKCVSLFGDVEEVVVTRDGETIQSYIFDEKGNVIQKTEYECDGDTPDTYKFTYNENGLLESSKVTRGGKTYNAAKYKYDANNNLIEEVLSDGVREKNTHKYDEKGNKIESKYYISGKVINKIIYKYDELGNLTEEIISDPKGREIWTHIVYEYNSEGNLYRRTYADCSYKFVYDKHGNKLEEQLYTTDGTLCSKEVYKYDSKGNVTEKSSYKADGTLSYQYTYDIEYDSKNNISKATSEVFLNGEKSDVVLTYKLKIKYR